MSKTLVKTADDCRAAIGAGDYDTADRLLAALRSQMEESWPDADSGQRQAVAQQVLELLSWARQTVLARRSHAQRRLLQMNCNRAYLPSRSAADGCVDFDG